MKVLDQAINDNYAIYNGDCVEVIRGLPDNSIDFTIYSPPFESLYMFSNSDRDMSNCTNSQEFFDHYRYLIDETYRTTKPGRLVSVHCINMPTTKNRDGYIGIRDFRGDIIRAHQDAGFIFHSEVVIWKDPVVSMQRTKALGLLHAQVKKDSSMSRQGIPDYLVTFRKPGENEEKISGMFDAKKYAGENAPPASREMYQDDNGRYVVRTDEERLEWDSIEVWQRYASPVWFDIRQGNVISNHRDGRDSDDEKHITPLQLDVIERALQLWTLPGETVFTPFLGVGSEAYQSIIGGRKAVGIELKESYFAQAKKNCERAVVERENRGLFDE